MDETLRSGKSYHIIHKVEKQVSYERARNINKTLHMYKNKSKMLISNTLSMTRISQECIFLIDKIKEYRHSKIKDKQINQFDRLLRKCNGYYHNFGTFDTFSRHTSFSGHPHNTNYTNIENNSSFSSATFTTTAPTAPTATMALATTALPVHTVPCNKNTRSSIYPPFPHLSAGITFSQETQFHYSNQVPPGSLTSQQ